jgi:hypothetical protein
LIYNHTIARDYRLDLLTRDGQRTADSADLSTLQVIAPRRAVDSTALSLSGLSSALSHYIKERTMKREYIKAFNELKKLGCPVFERSDYSGRFLISAEEPESYKWASYYNEYNQWQGDDVNPVLMSILAKNNLFCEWENPACLVVFPA